MRDRKSDAHRTNLAASLGHSIKEGHDVDHLDGDKDNNAPTNLQELSHSAHSSKTGGKAQRHLETLRKSLRMVQKKEKLY